MRWLDDQGHTAGTIGRYLETLSSIVRWLGRRRIKTLDQLTEQKLQMAQDHYQTKQEGARGVVRMLKRFLTERRLVPEGNGPPPCPVEVEIERFATYPRNTRGLAEATVTNHGTTLRAFLRHLRFNGKPTVLSDSTPADSGLPPSISANHDRFSLQHVVATLRAYLQERHAREYCRNRCISKLIRDEFIVENGCPERCPAPGQAFLRSIDRSDPFGGEISRFSTWPRPTVYATESWSG